jgi:hypothetical protein
MKPLTLGWKCDEVVYHIFEGQLPYMFGHLCGVWLCSFYLLSSFVHRVVIACRKDVGVATIGVTIVPNSVEIGRLIKSRIGKQRGDLRTVSLYFSKESRQKKAIKVGIHYSRHPAV